MAILIMSAAVTIFAQESDNDTTNANVTAPATSEDLNDGENPAENTQEPPAVDAISGAQESNTNNEAPQDNSDKKNIAAPAPRRPSPADSQKLAQAANRDSDNEEFDKGQKTLGFGTSSEICTLVDKITKSEDVRYNDALYDTFTASKSLDVKTAILGYYLSQKDPCLEDWVFQVISEPEDIRDKTVLKCIEYAATNKLNSCSKPLRDLLDSDNEKYFAASLRALGDTGDSNDATYIADFLDREDLTAPQRQALMHALGALHAQETFDKVAEIAEDTSEDTFVRCYALEALGGMQKSDALEILTKNYEIGDPNVRQYCIAGLCTYCKNATDDNALNTIIFAIKDDHWKVRMEAIKAIESLQQGLASDKITAALDNLMYRAKNDKEIVIKNKALKVIAQLNNSAGNDFLIGLLTDEKVGDATKIEVSKVLLESGATGVSQIIDVTKDALSKDTKKGLRTGLGKLLIKYALPEFSELCELYLQSKDSNCVMLGLTLYKVGKYSSCTPIVESIARGKSSNHKYAQKLLGNNDAVQSN